MFRISMLRKLTTAAWVTLIISCANHSLNNPTSGNLPLPDPTAQLPEVKLTPLLEEISARIKVTYAKER